jgi:hypothetical protein
MMIGLKTSDLKIAPNLIGLPLEGGLFKMKNHPKLSAL